MNWIIREAPEVAIKVGPNAHSLEVEHEARVELTTGPLTLSLSPGQAGGLRTALENAIASASLIHAFLEQQGIEQEYRPTEKGGEPPGRAFREATGHYPPLTALFWPTGEAAPRRLLLTLEEFDAKFEMVPNG
jgi:hypothetical protein